MTVLVLLLIALVPMMSVAQPAADTLDYENLGQNMPADLNCGDFQSQQDANRWYGRAQLYFGEIDAYNVDGDNDGQPCEGIEVAKREILADSVWVDYRLEAYRVRCRTAPEGFTMEEAFEQMITATTDSVPYRGPEGIQTQYECIHNLSLYNANR